MEYVLIYSLYVLVLSVLMGVSTWKLFQKMGYKPIIAFIPFYNYFVILKETKNPRWWVAFVYFPIVGTVMMSAFHLFLMKKFGRDSIVEKLLTVFLPFIYMAKINYASDTEMLRYEDNDDKETLIGSLSYAVVFATLIHYFIAQPFTIPTGSMERTLLVGDFLVVNKMNYGLRLPMRPISIPFLQSTIFDKGNDGNPKNDPKSYVDAVKLPYFRLPGWEEVNRNDIVVFNYPDDTVHVSIDRKDPYVKRAVAVAGDVLEMKEGKLFINGKPELRKGDAEVQQSYIVKSKTQIDIPNLYKVYGFVPVEEVPRYHYLFKGLTEEQKTRFKELFGDSFIDRLELSEPIDADYVQRTYHIPAENIELTDNYFLYIFSGLTPVMAKEFSSIDGVLSVEPKIEPKGMKEVVFSNGQINEPNTIFPYNKDWNRDWYGPLRIPKKGDVIQVNTETLPMYRKLISEFEGNTLEVNGDKILINGTEANQYEVKLNYYFMVGDNRDASLDSRYFGFVPETHIVGKPMFSWMSVEGLFSNQNSSYQANGKKIRFDRMFKATNTGEKEKTSYWWIAVILFVAFFWGENVLKFFKKKNKEEI